MDRRKRNPQILHQAKRRVLVGRLILGLIVIAAVAGCVSYAYKVRNARHYFEWGEYDSAIHELKQLADKKDNDHLLYLMDLGLVYHTAGRYEDAIATFHLAEKLAERNDYTSVVTEAGTVLLNDEIKAYRGEDFEKILINMYLAIDYTLLGKFDDGLVEAKRVNRKLDQYIREGKMPYEQNGFAKYLSAVLFEARREINDAFVDYRQLLKWQSTGAGSVLGVPLLRIADKLKFSQEYAQYRKEFPEIKNYKLEKGHGEIVLLLEQGKAPYKAPNAQFRLLPIFLRNYYSSDSVILKASGSFAHSVPLFSIENAAIRELDHKMGLIIAKKMGGVVIKEAAGYAVAQHTKNRALGELVSLALHLTDQADLRSWTTLPARLHIARLSVPAGRHIVSLDMVAQAGKDEKDVKIWKDIEVKAGQITFLNYRTRD